MPPPKEITLKPLWTGASLKTYANATHVLVSPKTDVTVMFMHVVGTPDEQNFAAETGVIASPIVASITLSTETARSMAKNILEALDHAGDGGK